MNKKEYRNRYLGITVKILELRNELLELQNKRSNNEN